VRRRTARRQLEGEGEAWTRQRRRTAGDPHGDARGPGQIGDWFVLFPLQLRSHAKAMQLVWKLRCPGLLNAIAAGQLIHMLDQILNRRFLVAVSGHHPGFSLPYHHQGAAGFPGHGELLQVVSVQHRPHAAAADRRPAQRQEGGGQAGVVGGHLRRYCRSEAGPPLSNIPGSSHSGGGAVSGGGRLSDERGGVLAAAVA
jgi:hypothetical protein